MFDFGTAIKYIFQSTLPRRERQGQTFSACPFLYFNPRSREGSDGIRIPESFRRSGFQSTLPRRERRTTLYASATSTKFQSTLPRRERPAPPSNPSSAVLFQSTLPRRERLMVGAWDGAVLVFQSTLPRRERRPSTAVFKSGKEISIHAPAKGATAFINIFSLTVRLFLFHLTNKI